VCTDPLTGPKKKTKTTHKASISNLIKWQSGDHFHYLARFLVFLFVEKGGFNVLQFSLNPHNLLLAQFEVSTKSFLLTLRITKLPLAVSTAFQGCLKKNEMRMRMRIFLWFVPSSILVVWKKEKERMHVELTNVTYFLLFVDSIFFGFPLLDEFLLVALPLFLTLWREGWVFQLEWLVLTLEIHILWNGKIRISFSWQGLYVNVLVVQQCLLVDSAPSQVELRSDFWVQTPLSVQREGRFLAFVPQTPA